MIWQARTKISFYQTNQVISFASFCISLYCSTIDCILLACFSL